MKKNGLPLVIAIAVLLILGVYLLSSPKHAADSSAGSPATSAPTSHAEDPTKPSAPLSPAEAAKAKTSLKQMTQVLAAFTLEDKKLNDLLEALKKDQQEPFTVKDKNPYTGEMIIVRTKSPPPGTRYFHAQYFVDENNQSFAQHMSFEFRQSPEAMDQAIQMVKATFPNLGNPTEESRDFIQWELDDGYVVWVKRLDEQDITNNPFNAYTPGDIGSIRIAVELSPEADEH